MPQDIWFKDDIRRILTLTRAAARNASSDYHQAVHDIGLAFDLDLDLTPDPTIEGTIAGASGGRPREDLP